MNDFARFFLQGFITLVRATSAICMHVYKGNNMLLVIFLSKQQIFSPGLLTRPVLIMSVAEDGGEGSPIIFLSFSFLPQTFFHPCAASCQGKEVDFCVCGALLCVEGFHHLVYHKHKL